MRILTITILTATLAACGTSATDSTAAVSDEAPAPLAFEEVRVTSRADSIADSSDTDSPAPDLTEQSERTGGEAVATLEDPADTEPSERDVAETPEPTVPLTTYALRRGETLAHFARWAELPVENIAESSELPLDGQYAVGTEIAIPLSPELRSQVETRRDAHHRTRAERYLASRGADETEFYSVKTGDSAWTIANDRHGMPVWLLESLNPSANLDRLRPGDELLVPVFTDIVAEAPSEDVGGSDDLREE